MMMMMMTQIMMMMMMMTMTMTMMMIMMMITLYFPAGGAKTPIVDVGHSIVTRWRREIFRDRSA
jgi:hypothetical protein